MKTEDRPHVIRRVLESWNTWGHAACALSLVMLVMAGCHRS
jgi:hypothetical protein